MPARPPMTAPAKDKYLIRRLFSLAYINAFVNIIQIQKFKNFSKIDIIFCNI